MRHILTLAAFTFLLAGCGAATPIAGPQQPLQAFDASKAAGIPIKGAEARTLQAKIVAELLRTSFRARGKSWFVLEEGEDDFAVTLAYTKADKRVVRFAIDHMQASDGEQQGADVWVGGEYEVASGKLLKHRGKVNEITF